MKLQFKREAGQSIIIVAIALIGLVALLSLVVDAGNAYVQERQFSNAIDAGSQAGAIGVAQNKTDGQIAASITQYLNTNGIITSGSNANGSVTYYYVVQNSQGNKIVDTAHPIGTNGTNNVVTQTLVAGAWDPVVGVQLQGSKTFPTYIAGIVGWRQMQVGAGASSYGTCGASSSSDLFPIALANTTFVDTNHNGVGDMNDMSLVNDYQIFEQTTGSALAKFGYVTWNNDISTGTLDARIGDLDSGPLNAGDSIKSVSDSMHSDSTILNKFNSLLANGTSITIPVYDTYSSGVYHIVGFARVKITYVHDSSTASDRYIKVKFQVWVDPTGTGGAPDYGVCSVKTSQTTAHPELKVTVYYRPIYPNPDSSKTFYHADVVNVLDISGSMTDSFGSKSKLQAAKDALTNFNNNLQTGDQTSLVTFPRISSGSSYNYSCTRSGSYSTYYFATQVDGLTSNFAHVNSDINGLSANGGTPLAAGLQQGLLTVRGSGHTTDNLPVIILASDGLTNIRLDGKWTGFQGDSYSSPSCNSGAVNDATDQANLAKADPDNDGIPQAIIYTIAVGDDFNPDVLQAIASLDTNPAKPHYFRATDATSMASIYAQISNQVKTISSDCFPSYGIAPVPAKGASVSIKAPDGSTTAYTTNSTGEVLITNPQVGTYQFMGVSYSDGNGIAYNILSDGFGGANYSGNPILQVGNEDQTYPASLYLKNSTQPTCTH